jgi:hypothetical protein
MTNPRIISNKLGLLRSVLYETKAPAIRNLLCAINRNDTLLPQNYKWLIANGWYPSWHIFRNIRVYKDEEIKSILEISIDSLFIKYDAIKYSIYYARTAEDIANIRAQSRNMPSIIIAYDSECIMNAGQFQGEFIITESQLYEILDDPALKWRSFAIWPKLWHIWLALTIIGFTYKKYKNNKNEEKILYHITFDRLLTLIHKSLRDNGASMFSLGIADCNAHADIIKVDNDKNICHIISCNPNRSIHHKLIYIHDSDSLDGLPGLIDKTDGSPLNIIIYNDDNLEKGDILEFINELEVYNIVSASYVISRCN